MSSCPSVPEGHTHLIKVMLDIVNHGIGLKPLVEDREPLTIKQFLLDLEYGKDLVDDILSGDQRSSMVADIDILVCVLSPILPTKAD